MLRSTDEFGDTHEGQKGSTIDYCSLYIIFLHEWDTVSFIFITHPFYLTHHIIKFDNHLQLIGEEW